MDFLIKNKVIVIDWSIFLHKAVFCYPMNPGIPPTYNCCNMIISSLYKLAVDPDDIIIVAQDGRNSWRKDYELAYKANRAEARANSGIDWDHWYSEFNNLTDQLQGLNWHWIKINRLEADDVMAVTCRYYKDREVILLTHDADLKQMWEYPNVKIFSTLSKKQGGGKWAIKPSDWDITRFQAEKIYKEVTDNMITEVLGEQDYEKRRLCVNLLELPEWVEKSVLDELNKIGPKDCNLQCLTFVKLREKLANLYNDYSKVVSYDDQIAKEQSKKDREVQKKKIVKDKINKATSLVEKKLKKQLELTEAKYEAKLKREEAKRIKIEAMSKIVKVLKPKKEKDNGNKITENSESTKCHTS